ncbi:MAG TPA: GGDEF domain-containing protein, partial [Nitrospiria bacterium]|nr:GGDEF domain-containing protein [Nitrospiria bacterium]
MVLSENGSRFQLTAVTVFQKVLKCLDQCGRIFILAAAFGGVVVLGVVDYATGFEISFSLFYLVPVSFAAWYAGKWPGIAIAFFSAAAWDLANGLAGQVFSNPAILYWNTATRLGFFAIVTLLLSRLRRELDHERDSSRTDFLTGVANHRAFYDKARVEILRLARNGRPFTVAHFDLDNFKEINDRYGHVVGDEVLRVVAKTISANLRGIDMIARLGGDEFVILLPETDADPARLAVGKIQKVLSGEMDRNRWMVTFSIGVVTFGAPPRSVEEMINKADRLMYDVKTKGKDAAKYSSY